ncbi:unnamed protein product, partial [Effrenium voratum]
MAFAPQLRQGPAAGGHKLPPGTAWLTDVPRPSERSLVEAIRGPRMRDRLWIPPRCSSRCNPWRRSGIRPPGHAAARRGGGAGGISGEKARGSFQVIMP